MNHMIPLWTHNGFLGLGPPQAQRGDLIYIILGAYTPFLLRQKTAGEGQRRLYELVGECYMHGLMNGEGLDMGEEQATTLV